MAKKRAATGFKKGKHGSKRDIFEDIDEEAIRESIRKSVHDEDSKKSSMLSYAVLALVIGAIIGGYFLYFFVIVQDEDNPYTSSVSTDDEYIYGVSLKIITKEGGDGSHEPYEYSLHKVDPSVGTQYLLLVKNRGNIKDSFALSSNAPSGWTVQFEGGNEVKEVAKGEWTYKIVTVRVSTGASENFKEIKIVASSKSDPTKQASVITKNTVEALPPGTADLDKHPANIDYNLVYYGGGKEKNENGWYHNQGGAFDAQDNSVIPGFEEAIKGMREGQTKVVEVPPEKGYGPDDEKHVGGRPLVFEITIIDRNMDD
ncbi:MAG: FKBP-type peptidyl-prolyl cis-trans isomerase [Candidatus Thermoplasmatota archaeon]|nr:FKBP-type peptidyl-prolyl cis-trans isomerase [Candidatus Thermoplasmatota archaeon]